MFISYKKKLLHQQLHHILFDLIIIFHQLADYFHSILISIDYKNMVPLRSAVCFIQYDTSRTLLGKHFAE